MRDRVSVPDWVVPPRFTRRQRSFAARLYPSPTEVVGHLCPYVLRPSDTLAMLALRFAKFCLKTGPLRDRAGPPPLLGRATALPNQKRRRSPLASGSACKAAVEAALQTLPARAIDRWSIARAARVEGGACRPILKLLPLPRALALDPGCFLPGLLLNSTRGDDMAAEHQVIDAMGEITYYGSG